jgi:hypothetical protein
MCCGQKPSAVRNIEAGPGLVEDGQEDVVAMSLTASRWSNVRQLVRYCVRFTYRTAVESTFAALALLIATLDAEQMRAVQEGLSQDELAVFDLIQSGDLTKAERERVKQASRELLVSLQAVLAHAGGGADGGAG